MNALFETTFQGALGELIAQTFLLAHGVQAASPIKDSGNDLIAVRGQEFRAVQVRTSRDGGIDKPDQKCNYHILAVVHLPFTYKGMPLVSEAKVFLFPKDDVKDLKGTVSNYPKAAISDTKILELWPDPIVKPEAAGVVSSPPRYNLKAGGGSALGQ